jgi:tRNA(fMet)-specific endonuclease VapC
VRYVLDTNAVSALMKGDTNALDQLRKVARTDVSVPQPVLAELAYGISRLPASRRRERLRDRYERLRSELPRAPWSDDVTDHFGEIKAGLERKGERLEDFDAAVAAHALAHGATLVTANLRHMRRIPGLRVDDWTKPS